MTTPRLLSSGWRIRPRDQRTILLVGDLLVSIVALICGLYFWGQKDAWLNFSWDFLQNRVAFWFYLLPLFWILLLVELYDLHRARNPRQTLTWIAIAGATGVLLYALVYLVSPPNSLPRWGIGIFLIVASMLTLAWRSLYILLVSAEASQRRVLVIGAGNAGAVVARIWRDLRPQPFLLVGFMDDDPAKLGTQVEGFPVLASNELLLETIARESITELVIAISGEMRGTTFQVILDAQEQGVEVVPMASLYEELLGRVPVHHLESDWLIRSFVDQARVGAFYEASKRMLDILGSLVGLMLCAGLLPLVSIGILLESGRPVFYPQTRSGKGAKPYTMYKFRSMRQDAEKAGKQLTSQNDTRITRFGNLLRRTHIDELPQFLNVLRGQMSLVGPRSERPEWIEEFQKQIPFYRARLLVKPGITGWAQVNYSYYATVEEMAIKLEYDLYYIKHRSLVMDLVILLKTITQVIGFRGR
jgi:exopolysaccharide biosynthesis polyprenyl glycosylphosphotransferase